MQDKHMYLEGNLPNKLQGHQQYNQDIFHIDSKARKQGYKGIQMLSCSLTSTIHPQRSNTGRK